MKNVEVVIAIKASLPKWLVKDAKAGDEDALRLIELAIKNNTIEITEIS